MLFEVGSEISATPEEAFDRMADARNEIRWNSQVTRSELASDEPVRAGTVFKTVNRGREYTATISTYDRPGLLVFDVTGKPMHITATFRFRPSGGRTAFEGEFEMRPMGLMRLIFPAMKPLIRRDLARQSQSFKAFCESS